MLERLTSLAEKLIAGATNPFHARVTSVVGKTCKPYYVEHAADGDPLAELVHDVVGDEAARGLIETYVSKLLGKDICFANLCCSGCKASLGRLCLNDSVKIQNAAVRTDENGEEIHL
ncbi:MAG: hypothetical protein FGM57_03575 [Candidatus Taylorbacteria bacterium]|nr:hypothetical protein [Candidatus Taylorbacteria bacterium]